MGQFAVPGKAVCAGRSCAGRKRAGDAARRRLRDHQLAVFLRKSSFRSFPRKRESSLRFRVLFASYWFPAFAGMTIVCASHVGPLSISVTERPRGARLASARRANERSQSADCNMRAAGYAFG
jgi:hypothetical protein